MVTAVSTSIISFLFLVLGCTASMDIDQDVIIPNHTSNELIIEPISQINGDELGDNETTKPIDSDKIPSTNDTDQMSLDEFSYEDDLHWTHMPVTYAVTNEDDCGRYETNKIDRGFNDIMIATDGVVHFQEVNNSADIEITCSFIEDCYELTTDIDDSAGYVTRYESVCAHDKGVAQITEYSGNKILKARIELIGLAGFAETDRKGPSGFYIGSCGHPTTEVHEILHTFGYGHNEDNNSIMYEADDFFGSVLQEPGDCQGSMKEIDDDIVEDLINVYFKPDELSHSLR